MNKEIKTKWIKREYKALLSMELKPTKEDKKFYKELAEEHYKLNQNGELC